MAHWNLRHAFHKAPRLLQLLLLLLLGAALFWLLSQQVLMTTITHLLQSFPVFIVLPPAPGRSQGSREEDPPLQAPPPLQSS
jgi:hypothetical protein